MTEAPATGIDPIQVSPATRVRELDGVRGIAILLVVIGHVGGAGLVPSGAGVGVILFFVLSGYLITSLLLRQWQKTADHTLGGFYARRARRLLPALVPFLAAYAAYAAAHDDSPRSIIGACLGVLFFTANVSGAWGWHIPEILGHTWSLAVEEQFYLAWPLALFLLLRLDVLTRRRLLVLVIAGAVATAAARGGLALAGFNQDRLYVTLRADSLLAGCALAVAALRPSRRVALLGLIGLVGCSAVIWNETAASVWGYALMTLFSVALVSGAPAVSQLGHPLLVRCGVVSYGWYLWHVPLWKVVDNRVAVVLGSFALAELSYRLIERRFVRRPAPMVNTPS